MGFSLASRKTNDGTESGIEARDGGDHDHTDLWSFKNGTASRLRVFRGLTTLANGVDISYTRRAN